jgi:predicted nuclease of predicted toxin-antitoxin system
VRVLLDECVNPRVRAAFVGHEVETVADAQWRGSSDVRLLTLAQGRFDVVVTIDRGFEFEHNLKKLDFGIVIVHVRKNRMEHYRPLFEAMAAAVGLVQPGAVLHVGGAVESR